MEILNRKTLHAYEDMSSASLIFQQVQGIPALNLRYDIHSLLPPKI